MSNPRIEEVDSDEESIDQVGDPDEMDLETFDFARPQHGTLQTSTPAMPQTLPIRSSIPHPQQPSALSDKDREGLFREQQQRTRSYQCIYPVYFDSTRSREQGRRVKKSEGVENPLARTIVDALSHLASTQGIPGMQVALEPSKTHPKDWANPGRVRVLVKKDGKAVSGKIANKHHLYKLIAAYLRGHPTTKDSPLQLRLHGLPLPKDGEVPTPAIPRGFKMGTVLPLHSPALTGGGVSENFLQDMMAEMGGQMPEGIPPGLAGLAGASGGSGGVQPKKVKDKKEKKKK